MGGRWMSYADALPVNRAMPFWLEIARARRSRTTPSPCARRRLDVENSDTEALRLRLRLFSDAFLYARSGQAEIEAELGRTIEVRNDISSKSGGSRNAWIGQLPGDRAASSFLEPLEATSIHGTVVQLHAVRAALI